MTYWYAIVAGEFKPWVKASRQAVDFVSNLEGYVGVHPTYHPDKGHVTLWFFDNENNAKRARNSMIAQGIIVGDKISKWRVGADGVPEVVKP